VQCIADRLDAPRHIADRIISSCEEIVGAAQARCAIIEAFQRTWSWTHPYPSRPRFPAGALTHLRSLGEFAFRKRADAIAARGRLGPLIRCRHAGTYSAVQRGSLRRIRGACHAQMSLSSGSALGRSTQTRGQGSNAIGSEGAKPELVKGLANSGAGTYWNDQQQKLSTGDSFA
jgi:hypothetical protein